MGRDAEGIVQRTILDEIGGKNSAIHAYDKMIWTVRTGFLTLIFAGWGLLLSSLAAILCDASMASDLSRARPLVGALFVVSMVLGIAGFVVDRSYVRRKFRVIVALDEILRSILAGGERALSDPETLARLGPFVSVSGDTSSRDYLRSSGYVPAFRESLVVFGLPLVGVALAGICLLDMT